MPQEPSVQNRKILFPIHEQICVYSNTPNAIKVDMDHTWSMWLGRQHLICSIKASGYYHTWAGYIYSTCHSNNKIICCSSKDWGQITYELGKWPFQTSRRERERERQRRYVSHERLPGSDRLIRWEKQTQCVFGALVK